MNETKQEGTEQELDSEASSTVREAGVQERLEQVIDVVKALYQGAKASGTKQELVDYLISVAPDLKGLAAETADTVRASYEQGTLPDEVKEIIIAAGKKALGVDMVNKALDALGFAKEHKEELITIVQQSEVTMARMPTILASAWDQLYADAQDGEITPGELAQTTTTMMYEIATTMQGNTELVDAVMKVGEPILARAIYPNADSIASALTMLALDYARSYVMGKKPASSSGTTEFAVTVGALLMGDQAWSALAKTLQVMAPVLNDLINRSGYVWSQWDPVFNMATVSVPSGLKRTELGWKIKLKEAAENRVILDGDWIVLDFGAITMAINLDPTTDLDKVGTAFRVSTSEPYSKTVKKALNKFLGPIGKAVNDIAFAVTQGAQRQSLYRSLLEHENRVKDGVESGVYSTISGLTSEGVASLLRSLGEYVIDLWTKAPTPNVPSSSNLPAIVRPPVYGVEFGQLTNPDTGEQPSEGESFGNRSLTTDATANTVIRRRLVEPLAVAESGQFGASFQRPFKSRTNNKSKLEDLN